jgi:hypothetical protein
MGTNRESKFYFSHTPMFHNPVHTYQVIFEGDFDKIEDMENYLKKKEKNREKGESEDKVQEQIKFIRERIVKATNEEIENDREAMRLLRELGSDQTITPYVFNFKKKNGELNTDIKKMNELNKEIFNTLSMEPGEKATTQALLVTSSEFDPETYGNKFMNSLIKRLGVENQNNDPVTFII